jgi:hypothetical protein
MSIALWRRRLDEKKDDPRKQLAFSFLLPSNRVSTDSSTHIFFERTLKKVVLTEDDDGFDLTALMMN